MSHPRDNDVSGPVVVTGASGFLGRHVCAELRIRGIGVRALVRTPVTDPTLDQIRYRGLDDAAAIRRGLSGASAVVHLAARVHVMRDAASDPLAEFRRVNVEGTRALAAAAAQEGVSAFVYASSVKAVGEESARPWTELDAPAPVDAYGVSKLEAERALEEIACTGMPISVLRLPLVYGPGMRANMLRLFQLVDRGWPLPLGGIRNQRSLVYARNVGAAVAAVLARDNGYEAYFVSDGEDVSTPDLVRRIGTALGRPVRLVPAPVGLLELARRLRVPVLRPIATRLLGSLVVDSSRLRAHMGGTMPYTLDDGLRATAEWYRTRASAEVAR